jgi:hypothetical protein
LENDQEQKVNTNIGHLPFCKRVAWFCLLSLNLMDANRPM